MKFFWTSALISLFQVILLALAVKLMNRSMKMIPFLIFCVKIFIYIKCIFALVDKYFIYFIECVCGYIAGSACSAVLVFLVFPKLMVPLLKLGFKKLYKIEGFRNFVIKIFNLKENLKHRVGLGNEKGFKVKKLKF